MTQGKFWPDTGPTYDALETYETSRQTSECSSDITESISFAAATRAKKTADRELQEAHRKRVSAVSLSASLRRFALALFSEKTQAKSGPMLPGLGGDSEASWSDLVTLCCPSDSAPVALALTIGAKGCSCSPRYPTPTASSHNYVRSRDKLVTRRERQKALGRNGNGFGLNLGQYCAINEIPFSVELLETLMGFPAGWTKTTSDGSEMPSCLPSPNGLVGD